MNIQNLKIEGLYGYIDKEIEFKKDITLLVGINGSGKTSILNIISWIIKPSIPHLCITEFKTLTLTFKLKDKDYLIVCKHGKHIFTYELTTDNDTFAPLTVRINTPFSLIVKDENLRNNLLSEYQQLTPNTKELKTWNFIRTNLPNPTIIGLDRNLYTEESEKVFMEDNIRVRNVRKSQVSYTSPLDRVKEIVNTEYRKKKNSILILTNRLKNHLMLSAFEGNISLESVTTGIRYKLTLGQIATAEKRVEDYFQKFEKPTFTINDQQVLSAYFEQLKTITKQFQENPKDINIRLLFGLNASQFKKINNLLKEFEKFEKESSKTLEKINLYLDTLNFFFKDSSKKLIFNEDTTELTFNTLDRKGKTLTQFNDIRFLSSGEQQILILYSYLAFNSEDGRLFIIDEPELSLHIKWQEDFLKYLELIAPKTTQVILATHSPILVGKKKENAVLLYPYNC
jgi:predicted ATPase